MKIKGAQLFPLREGLCPCFRAEISAMGLPVRA